MATLREMSSLNHNSQKGIDDKDRSQSYSYYSFYFVAAIQTFKIMSVQFVFFLCPTCNVANLSLEEPTISLLILQGNHLLSNLQLIVS